MRQLGGAVFFLGGRGLLFLTTKPQMNKKQTLALSRGSIPSKKTGIWFPWEGFRPSPIFFLASTAHVSGTKANQRSIYVPTSHPSQRASKWGVHKNHGFFLTLFSGFAILRKPQDRRAKVEFRLPRRPFAKALCGVLMASGTHEPRGGFFNVCFSNQPLLPGK